MNTDQKEVRLWALRVPVGGESQAIGTISQGEGKSVPGTPGGQKAHVDGAE